MPRVYAGNLASSVTSRAFYEPDSRATPQCAKSRLLHSPFCCRSFANSAVQPL